VHPALHLIGTLNREQKTGENDEYKKIQRGIVGDIGVARQPATSEQRRPNSLAPVNREHEDIQPNQAKRSAKT